MIKIELHGPQEPLENFFSIFSPFPPVTCEFLQITKMKEQHVDGTTFKWKVSTKDPNRGH